MEFEEFCENVQNVLLDELEMMYEDSSGEEWNTIETVLRERLTLKTAFRMRQRQSKEYLKLLNSQGRVLYERLRAVRQEIAREQQLPPYCIFSNRTLFEMSRSLPFTMEEFRELYGVGKTNSSRYGERFLKEIHDFSNGIREETCSGDFLEKGEEGFPLIFGRGKQ